MKGQKKFIKLIREVINLIIKFFKPYGLQDSTLAIPRNVKLMGFKIGIMELGITFISLTFAFLLKITNVMIEYRFILIGILLFMLYRGQQVVREAFHLISSSENQKFDLIFYDEIVFRGAKIIGKVTDRVSKFDKSNNFYKVLTNEEVLNSIKSYLQNLWKTKIQHVFEICKLISVIVMLIFAIITNDAIPQLIFIPLILGFVLLSFFTSAYISLNREEYYQNFRKFDNEQSVIINDLLRVPVIVSEDLDMRISKFQKSLVSSNENERQFRNKLNVSYLITTVIEAFSQYGIIIFYLLGVEWNSISLATITEIAATLLIVETALGYIRDMAETMNYHNERVVAIRKEEQDIQLILDVYHKETERISKPKKITDIKLKPFSVKYIEESENDKPFSLISENNINLNNGEVVILYGPSGSGKSTFMKMLTERIKVEKSNEIPSTSRFLFYDEKLKFGSLSIFEELFCCNPNPNLNKMQEILENLNLWNEIKANCFDIWTWMKEKKYGTTLSNGQNQRLILAKMLYWLDDNIDVVVLDECTSGLDVRTTEDSADAERILEYIVRYCNKDKKRIVIISTHQDINGFVKNLANEYTFRSLQFKKEGGKNIVREI